MTPFAHRLTNDSLAPAPGDEATVVTLPIQRGRLDGAKVVRSFWRPSDAELAVLVQGGVIALTVYGGTHAPLHVGVAEL